MNTNGAPKRHPASLPDPMPAFERAAKKALELAKQTGTPCYVQENGKIVDLAKAKPVAKKSTRKKK